MPRTAIVPDPEAMDQLGRELVQKLKAGDVVLLSGPLGAGKTTLVRGMLHGLGNVEIVRSPTYNLIQEFPTDPPVMHADLYRVASHAGIGLEDYLSTHLCFIEWPDRAEGLVDRRACWQIDIQFEGEGRTVQITEPDAR